MSEIEELTKKACNKLESSKILYENGKYSEKKNLYVTESRCCTLETNTILQINHTAIKCFSVVGKKPQAFAKHW